jgi:hypothetical protein
MLNITNDANTLRYKKQLFKWEKTNQPHIKIGNKALIDKLIKRLLKVI